MLEVNRVCSGYGGGVVLDGFSLALKAGEAVALVGRNGVGKTTLMKTIMGLIRPSSGSIALAGKRIDGRAPFEIARAGVGYAPQGREIFAALSVEDNLLLGDLAARTADEAYRLFPALAARRNTPAGRLSGGQQQQLAIARALMARPRLLLLDEPSEGVQPTVVAEIVAALGQIVAQRGLALLLVEQNIEMALALVSRFVLVDQGRAVATHAASAVAADPSLLMGALAL